MKIRYLTIILAAGLFMAGCRLAESGYIEEPEEVPVVFIEGDANSFYVQNGPRFDKAEPLIEYLKKHYDRIILREADKSISFAEKLIEIFTRHGIAVQDYVYFHKPPKEEEEAKETLEF